MVTERPGQLIRSALVLVAVGWLAAAAPARAHFAQGAELRVVHFTHDAEGLHAFVRMTLPLVVGDLAGPVAADGSFAPPPYIWNRVESGQLFHYVDAARLQAGPARLGRVLAERLWILDDGRPLTAEPRGLAVYPRGFVPPFNSAAEAAAATAGPVWPERVHGDVDALDVLVDAHLLFPEGQDIGAFDLIARGNAGPIGRPDTVTMLVDHRAGGTSVYRFRGELTDAVRVNPGWHEAALTFTREGARHILEGPDHLLFLVCLILGAGTLTGLVTAVTGFTVGHTITLIAGGLGLVPQAPWFVPLVETAIALSILYAAAAVVLRPAHRLTFAVVLAIGLLHGLGFSFGLQELLQPEAPHLVLSLAAFNLGIELAQVGIAAALWPLLLIARQQLASREPVWRGAAAGCAGLVALVWLWERAPLLMASLA